MIDIGFTGTQIDMTRAQATALFSLLEQAGPFVGHHGDCVGADATFDAIARMCSGFHHMEIYPMKNAGNKRAHCKPGPLDIIHPEALPLMRNEDIARVCKFLVATPKEPYMVLRSGTWSTVRYARKMNKPTVVILPSGALEVTY